MNSETSRILVACEEIIAAQGDPRGIDPAALESLEDACHAELEAQGHYRRTAHRNLYMHNGQWYNRRPF